MSKTIIEKEKMGLFDGVEKRNKLAELINSAAYDPTRLGPSFSIGGGGGTFSNIGSSGMGVGGRIGVDIPIAANTLSAGITGSAMRGQAGGRRLSARQLQGVDMRYVTPSLTVGARFDRNGSPMNSATYGPLAEDDERNQQAIQNLFQLYLNKSF